MIKFLKKYSYAFFLGMAPGFVGIHFWQWQWWVMVVPVICFIAWREWDMIDNPMK